jgi:hypothetical protein
MSTAAHFTVQNALDGLELLVEGQRVSLDDTPAVARAGLLIALAAAAGTASYVVGEYVAKFPNPSDGSTTTIIVRSRR